jgi:hypothetical protein
MKILLLAFSIIFFSQTTLSAARTPEIKCPQDGIGSTKGDAPAILIKTPKGHLLLCGFHEKIGTESHYSEFNIYSESKGKYSKSLYQVGALDTYKVEPFDGGLNLIELISFRGKQTPFQTLAMNCNLGDQCSISKATCETQSLVPFKTDILKRIKPFYKNGKNPSEDMMMELSDLAMTGNSNAIQIFQKNPGIKVDGAIAEIFKKTQSRLEHPCLKN